MARILVIHPTLGTGGGSRWSLQAAEALAGNGHDVDWVAAPSRGTLVEWDELRATSYRRHLVSRRWPEAIAGRARAICSTLRVLALMRWARRNLPQPDGVLLDAVPFVLAQARRSFPRSRLGFYCHFPEALYGPNPPWPLGWQRRYWIRRERQGLGQADVVFVNGHFTRRYVLGLFPELATRVCVSHPAVRGQPDSVPVTPRHILTVGRWTPDKNLSLSVRAYAEYWVRMRDAGSVPLGLRMAGAFDAWNAGADAAWREVQALPNLLGLPPEACRFVRNPADAELDRWYREALALVHPAPLEHFGMIAPEAMIRGVPVIGIAGSGLADSVVPGETGFLVPAEPAAIAARLVEIHDNPVWRARLGANARRRAEEHFLLGPMGARLGAALLRDAAETLPRARAAAPPPLQAAGGHGQQ